ncbi:MAG: cell envelope protein SmpA [Rhodoferax sp.]|nr:cell envelope protein SmpA [Rhodoferax sp.]
MFAPLPRGCSSALILGVCAVLAACSTVDDASRKFASSITPYKVEVVQGNFVSKEQVEALKPGMPRQQVKDILGTPLLQSVFHSDRWDYVFTMRRQGLEPQARQLTAYFKDNVLDRVEGDPMPTEAEFVALLGDAHKVRKVPQLEASEDSLKSFAKSEAPAKSAAATPAAPPPPAAASYPPLEAPAK